MPNASVFSGLVIVLLLSGCTLPATTDLATHVPTQTSRPEPTPSSDDIALLDSLRAELAAIAGDAPYIVIDRSRNRLHLRNPNKVLREATCATGSGKILFGQKHNQTWHFQTPRRVFTVQKKVTDPIWKKPVWAFVEKNQSAPVLPWEFRRLDGTTLGDYALELEDSYAIHGTLYPNLLGRSITHGCIRLNTADLAAAYATTPVGTKVYIF